jgi:hypothetical protein
MVCGDLSQEVCTLHWSVQQRPQGRGPEQSEHESRQPTTGTQIESVCWCIGQKAESQAPVDLCVDRAWAQKAEVLGGQEDFRERHPVRRCESRQAAVHW